MGDIYITVGKTFAIYWNTYISKNDIMAPLIFLISTLAPSWTSLTSITKVWLLDGHPWPLTVHIMVHIYLEITVPFHTIIRLPSWTRLTSIWNVEVYFLLPTFLTSTRQTTPNIFNIYKVNYTSWLNIFGIYKANYGSHFYQVTFWPLTGNLLPVPCRYGPKMDIAGLYLAKYGSLFEHDNSNMQTMPWIWTALAS